MFRRLSSVAVALTLVTAGTLAAQAPVTIKLGTSAPRSSPWFADLSSMGQAWARATDNRLRVVVQPDKKESSAITDMALGGLQAVTLSAPGLADIDKSFNVFGMPFFLESDAELAHVQEKLTPLIAAKLEAKNYKLINWGNAGWVQVFSKDPIRSLAELKAARLYTGEGSPEMVQWYTANGFNAKPLDPGQIPLQLKNPVGAINATPAPPALAVALGFFKDAPYMLNIRVAPLTSATVMSADTWKKISAADQAKILEAAKATQAKIHADSPGLDARSIATMKAAGLHVVELDAKAKQEFKTAADALLKTQSGSLVPVDIFNAAVAARDSYRKSPPAR
jgi:TRAP-type C4-dicarboxylate transport system substrate-binding protein